jgi:hypothetical protein
VFVFVYEAVHLQPQMSEPPALVLLRGSAVFSSSRFVVSNTLVILSLGSSLPSTGGLMCLLQETDPYVKVKILIPTALTLESTLKNEFDENRRIEIRYFVDSSLHTILTSLTVDRKLCLVVELKNDTKDNSYKEVGLATYSNSESFVWTHASIFETLWIKSELYLTNGIYKE